MQVAYVYIWNNNKFKNIYVPTNLNKRTLPVT